MSNDKQTFEARCSEIRDAKAAVDTFQRASVNGPFETVTVHVHDADDAECIARFAIPVGAINELLSSGVSAVELAETIGSVLDSIAGARKGSRPLEA